MMNILFSRTTVRPLASAITTLILLSAMPFCHASGVRPETATVIIDEAERGGSINVTNTESLPVLLQTRIRDLPDDKGPTLIVTQPVTRLEPGQTQRVRFVMNSDTPLKVEHIKRVSFEGVAEKRGNSSQVRLGVRQDLPVIIVPAGQKRVRSDLWTDLKWSVAGDHLRVRNGGKSVIRLSPGVKVGSIPVTLKKSYILPGETLNAALPPGKRLAPNVKVSFSPVTRYGFSVGKQTAPLDVNV